MQLNEDLKQEFIKNIKEHKHGVLRFIKLYPHTNQLLCTPLYSDIILIIKEYCNTIYGIPYFVYYGHNKLWITIKYLRTKFIIYIELKRDSLVNLSIRCNYKHNTLFSMVDDFFDIYYYINNSTDCNSNMPLYKYDVGYIINAFMSHIYNSHNFIQMSQKSLTCEYRMLPRPVKYTGLSQNELKDNMINGKILNSRLISKLIHYVYDIKIDYRIIIHNDEQFKIFAQIMKIITDTIIEKLKI